jgi:hypothetical protein
MSDLPKRPEFYETMNRPACITCVWWLPLEGQTNSDPPHMIGECRRKPPAPNKNPLSTARFPVTVDEQFCGEHMVAAKRPQVEIPNLHIPGDFKA